MKLGHEGLTVGGNLTYAWTQPDLGALAAAAPGTKLVAHTLFATGDVSYPIVRSQAFSLSATAGLDFLNQTVDFTGVRLSNDRLRVGFLRIEADAADVSERRVPNWRAAGALEFRQGLDIFDASPRNLALLPGGTSRPGDPTSSLVRFSGQFELNMGRGLWLAVLPRAQYAFTPLLSFEQYSAGNYSIGRGYDPGSIIGDDGAGTSVELRWNRFTPLPRVNLAVQPFLFADGAWVWTRKIPAAGILADHDKVISLGGGLHAALNNKFRIDATVAVPMRATALQGGRHDPRFLLSLTTKLWPWGAR